ncbi:Hypothetical_protein [Hexamita inflata]|uniref:Hypothetical_protein n=1 Tax=Hexamita inflata TaxID=28002 RepID=A0AA86VLM7_9EUKA|nr:Hypothetical protein HINF_LOCUS57918 [Hexamita inflata]
MTIACIKAVFSDLTIQISIMAKTVVYDEIMVGGLVAKQYSLNWAVQNTVFINLNLNRGKYIGSICGYSSDNSGTILNVQVVNSTLSATLYTNSATGGLIGKSYNITCNINSVSIYNVTSTSTGLARLQDFQFMEQFKQQICQQIPQM